MHFSWLPFAVVNKTRHLALDIREYCSRHHLKMGRKSKRKRNSGMCVKEFNQLNINENPPIIDAIVCISDRLCFPLYQSQDATDEDEDINDVYLEFRPRIYFACSLCLACSDLCSNRSVICEQCNMVSYCSAQHRLQDQKKHEKLCSFLAEICHKNDGLSLARYLPPEEFRSFRIELLSILESAIGRYLELWEREIILYPKLCRLCHSNGNLICCPNCYMEFYCCDSHRGNHEKWCTEYRVFRSILTSQRKHGFQTPRVPNMFHLSIEKFPENFDSFAHQMYQCNKYYRSMDCSSYATLSLIATIPLTTLYSMQLASNDWTIKEELTIHIIGAELQFECADLNSWEKLFLHLLPKVKTLNLYFIGPELLVPSEVVDIFKEPELCQNCQSNGKVIKITFHCGKLYHQVDLPESSKPDIICLFNPGLYRFTGCGTENTWPKTIERFCNYKVPVLVTAYTEVEIPEEITRIKTICDIQIIAEPGRNPFSSQKPDRNFVSDHIAPLIYKNYYLSIVKGI